ncbi:hypothetical protein L226DRAFT_239777 [Lentinus tigrinus ALCF2SS1-7]|uniref:uncharacterized protein n=1 Tax=Lentinus tigrinus ALCF2SS1-7 TaxID=1328758 RepID=UPI0011661260|nr:hypothetical protein L226DRAFT_239777 [Lentinus tigrinus ALCF2SS1-7]
MSVNAHERDESEGCNPRGAPAACHAVCAPDRLTQCEGSSLVRLQPVDHHEVHPTREPWTATAMPRGLLRSGGRAAGRSLKLESKQILGEGVSTISDPRPCHSGKWGNDRYNAALARNKHGSSPHDSRSVPSSLERLHTPLDASLELEASRGQSKPRAKHA